MPVQSHPWHTYETGYPNKTIVLTGEQFQKMKNFLDCSPGLVFDFETSGLEWYKKSRACGLSLAGWDDRGVQCFYVPFRHFTGEAQLPLGVIGPALKEILGSNKFKGGHNLKFDIHFARAEGWEVNGDLHDTMIDAHFYDENRRIGLKQRAMEDLGIANAGWWEEQVNSEVKKLAKANRMNLTEYKKQYGYCQVPIQLCGIYACHDTDFTAQLMFFYEHLGIRTAYDRIWKTEMRLIRALVSMEEVGLPIDTDYLGNLRDSLGGVQKSLSLEIEEQLKPMRVRMPNLASDDEMREFLVNGLGLKLTKLTDKKRLSVAREVLEDFEAVQPVLKPIMKWRDAEKLRSTYTDAILERLDAYLLLHPDYQQVGTNTGRASCRNPNFQNQPVDDDDRAKEHTGKSLEDGGIDPWSIKRAYVNRGQNWVRTFWDYSQIELRVIAWYSKDPIMMETYLTGGDIHSRTSMEVFGTTEKSWRRKAKVLNFGLSYGMTEKGFSRNAKIPIEEAEKHMRVFFSRYHGIAEFRMKFWEQVLAQRCFFQNLWGRPRRIIGLASGGKWQRLRAQRQAIATLIQGTAAELTKESLVRLYDCFQENHIPAFLVATVHDEIQVDCHTDVLSLVARSVKERMEDYPEFAPIPIIVDGSYSITNWAEKHKLPA